MRLKNSDGDRSLSEVKADAFFHFITQALCITTQSCPISILTPGRNWGSQQLLGPAVWLGHHENLDSLWTSPAPPSVSPCTELAQRHLGIICFNPFPVQTRQEEIKIMELGLWLYYRRH